VKVTVKAFGLLAERLPGGGPVVVDCPEAGLTVARVLASVGIPEEEVFITIVNGKRVLPGHVLRPGDEVTFVPPVAGG